MRYEHNTGDRSRRRHARRKMDPVRVRVAGGEPLATRGNLCGAGVLTAGIPGPEPRLPAAMRPVAAPLKGAGRPTRPRRPGLPPRRRSCCQTSEILFVTGRGRLVTLL